MELVYQNMIYSFNCVYKDGLVSAGCDYSERKLLRCFCDDKKIRQNTMTYSSHISFMASRNTCDVSPPIFRAIV